MLCEKDPSCLSILNLKVDQNKVQKIEFDEGSVGVLVLLSKAQGRVVGNPREIMSAKPSKSLNSLFVNENHNLPICVNQKEIEIRLVKFHDISQLYCNNMT